jgi:hypothetical protein
VTTNVIPVKAVALSGISFEVINTFYPFLYVDENMLIKPRPRPGFFGRKGDTLVFAIFFRRVTIMPRLCEAYPPMAELTRHLPGVIQGK